MSERPFVAGDCVIHTRWALNLFEGMVSVVDGPGFHVDVGRVEEAANGVKQSVSDQSSFELRDLCGDTGVHERQLTRGAMGTRPDVDESLTLEQIEGRHWGNPPADATRLIKTVYGLRHKPVGTMDAEDLRVLLLQQESIDVLVPIALSRLEQNPLAEGDFYPGDLLAVVLKIPQTYWQQHPDQRSRASTVIGSVEALGNLDDHDAPHDIIRQQITVFQTGP